MEGEKLKLSFPERKFRRILSSVGRRRYANPGLNPGTQCPEGLGRAAQGFFLPTFWPAGPIPGLFSPGFARKSIEVAILLSVAANAFIVQRTIEKAKLDYANAQITPPISARLTIQYPPLSRMYFHPFLSNSALTPSNGRAKKIPAIVPCNAPCLKVRKFCPY